MKQQDVYFSASSRQKNFKNCCLVDVAACGFALGLTRIPCKGSQRMINQSLDRAKRSLARRRQRSRLPSRRRLAAERLEDRRLLAAAEGDVFRLPPQSLDSIGLTGALSSTIRWGDGTQTQASHGTPTPAGNIRFKFDYSLNQNSFFTNQVRQALEETGAALVQHFTDQFSAIIPAGSNSWSANVCHPSSTSAPNLLCGEIVDVSNRVRNVAANEIVVFAGARDIIDGVRGAGGPGGYGASGSQQWLNTVAGRGQAGALQNPQTDFAVWGGSVSFDNVGTDWYFNRDISEIGPNQVDFRTVAAHELMHVLGFGYSPIDRTSSWERLTSGSTFSGTAARNVYQSPPPLDTTGIGDGARKSHWGDIGQPALMRGATTVGQRQALTRLDLAALDDLGWQVNYPSPIVIENQTHVYGDDADYDVEVILAGTAFGRMSETIANITNVSPSLSVPPTQSVMAGEPLTLPESLFRISDPGFGTTGTNPPTSETFTYRIDWRDGTAVSTGTANVTQIGNATRDTLASFAVSHTYANAGNFQVAVTVTDDDGGSDTELFTVEVTVPPDLLLSLSKSALAEDSGANAAVLTVTRAGPAKDVDETIRLLSDDPSEATVPESVVILAGETTAMAAVKAEDDQLLDGTQSVTLTASGDSGVPAEIMLAVNDAESLSIELTAAEVREDEPDSVTLTVARSNSDTHQPLEVNVAGGDSDELNMPNPLIIQAGMSLLEIQLRPVNDDDPERTQRLTYTFTAAGYQGTSAGFDLLDDEHPLFQNPLDRFDANGNGAVTSGDALRVINEIGFREGPFAFDPETAQSDGLYLDVTGDYRASALDALQILNEIARRLLLSTGESELIAPLSDLALSSDSRLAKLNGDEEEFLLLAFEPGLIF
jgi:PKD repeat protein